MIADSVIGVSITRDSPNSLISPLVTPSTPPAASRPPSVPAPPDTSSPITITRGSRRISCSSASCNAWRMVFKVMMRRPLIRHVNVGQQRRRVGQRRRAGRGNGAVDQVGDLVVHRVEFAGLEQRRLPHAAAEMLEAVTVLAQLPHLVLAAIELRVARVMAIEAAGIDLDRAGPATVARALHRLARRLVHGEEIVAIDLHRGQAKAGSATGNVAAADRIGC